MSQREHCISESLPPGEDLAITFVGGGGKGGKNKAKDTLKTELEKVLEVLIEEKEQFESKAKRERTKAALAALPRRQSNRNRGNDTTYGEEEQFPDYDPSDFQ
ncbi:hypothetical protein TeGR_g5300 [Tetraparma gracilis]|uniref:Uncharacterized protein n=1 Tax=Tetraparma gracilis TaxID=2962635 RepID=A0ABQ6MTL1_9STRA|nr:hypothetical protein TeGR_g5300 [Tetraparma gracilis]